MNKRRYLCLDVGEKRIGVAEAEEGLMIAVPLETVLVDGSEVESIMKLIVQDRITDLIVGYPRNQSGEPTAQTRFVENFAAKFRDAEVTISFQDESLTSVLAEERLQATKRPYRKEDIDAEAARIILEDYLEARL